MIRRFINWLKGSHEKRSNAILDNFKSVHSELNKLNTDIQDEEIRNEKKIIELEEKNARIRQQLSKNSLVAKNIAVLLGETPAE